MAAQHLEVHSLDLRELCTPPRNWIAQVKFLAKQAAKPVHLDGDSTDCRELTAGGGTTYKVVTGNSIAEHLPWLMQLYKVGLANSVSKLVSRRVSPSENDRYGVNINVVEGIGGRYEWHVDPSPIAAILFVTAHYPGSGGELALHADGELMRIYPKPGLIVVFPGKEVEHSVLPLEENTARISIPMIYYYEDEKQYFPRELDDYLYGG